jgi:hypothetical protein
VPGRARPAARRPRHGDVDAVRLDRRVDDPAVQAYFGAAAAQLAGEVAAGFCQEVPAAEIAVVDVDDDGDIDGRQVHIDAVDDTRFVPSRGGLSGADHRRRTPTQRKQPADHRGAEPGDGVGPPAAAQFAQRQRRLLRQAAVVRGPLHQPAAHPRGGRAAVIGDVVRFRLLQQYGRVALAGGRPVDQLRGHPPRSR